MALLCFVLFFGEGFAFFRFLDLGVFSYSCPFAATERMTPATLYTYLWCVYACRCWNVERTH